MKDEVKIQNHLRTVSTNIQKVLDKYQHLVQSVMYLREDLETMSNNMNAFIRDLNDFMEEVRKLEDQKNVKGKKVKVKKEDENSGAE